MNRLFKPVEWAGNTNVYEVNLRQYAAEPCFKAFAGSLPRLRDMGVETLWFMPVTPISLEKRFGSLGSYYACSDYTDTNPEFGSVDDFRALVGQAHQLGFKVIIDWVANHTGWDHVWTRTNPEFYKKNGQGEFYDNNGWKDVIDLNYYDHNMRRAMIEAMAFWVNVCGIDGFRCDMAHLVPLDFWRQARTSLDNIKPLFWLAETEEPNYQQVFDCSYAWEWSNRSEKYYKGEIGMDEFKKIMQTYPSKVLPGTTHLFFTSNHDENSWNGTEYEKYELAALCFAVFTLTWPGISLIYSGQELPNYKRLKFFDKDIIDWDGEFHLHSFYRNLLKLRSGNDALRLNYAGAQMTLLDSGIPEKALVYLRAAGQQQVLTALNLGEQPLTFTLTTHLLTGLYRDVFSGQMKTINSSLTMNMPAWSWVVLERI